jgi:hypothetical protein
VLKGGLKGRILTKNFELCYSKYRMKVDKKYLIWGVAVVAGIGLFWAMATVVVPRVMMAMLKVGITGKVSTSSSYVLGEKILATADGKDSCRVSAFILDKNMRGVKGKRVVMNGEGLGTKEGVTNENGKVTVEFVSETAGQYPIGVSVDGVSLGKSVTLTFSKE